MGKIIDAFIIRLSYEVSQKLIIVCRYKNILINVTRRDEKVS